MSCRCASPFLQRNEIQKQRIGQLWQYLGCQKQVHRADQALLPRCKVALLGAVPCICCAPLLKNEKKRERKKKLPQSDWIPVTTRGTHTRLPDRRQKELRPGRLRKCARNKDKRMKTRRDKKVCVAAMKEKPSAQGQPMNPTSL